MFDGEEEIKDWELKDEEPPKTLKQKWEREEAAGPKRVVCSSCKKETSAGNSTCIFCGTDLCFNNEGDQCRPNYHNGKEIKSLGGVALVRDSCPVSCFLTWVKRLFKGV